jgi:hypothetical protein
VGSSTSSPAEAPSEALSKPGMKLRSRWSGSEPGRCRPRTAPRPRSGIVDIDLIVQLDRAVGDINEPCGTRSRARSNYRVHIVVGGTNTSASAP